MNFRGARSKAVQRAAKSLQLLPFGPLVLMLVIRNTQPTKDQRGHAITWDFNMFKGFHPKFEAKPWFRTGTTAFWGFKQVRSFWYDVGCGYLFSVHFIMVKSGRLPSCFIKVDKCPVLGSCFTLENVFLGDYIPQYIPNISPIVGMFRHWPTGDEQSKIQHTAERQEADVLSEGVRL